MDTVSHRAPAAPCYDLHSHSHHSDGVLSPTALVWRAREQGVDVLALTDHDSTAGLAEARRAAEAAGIGLVDGVELSVSRGDQLLHIVALGVDPDSPGLVAGLAGQRATRVERAERIAAKFDRLGIAGSLDGAIAQAGDAAPGRNHFARFLVEQGHARDTRQAFRRWLGRSGRCHVPSRWAGLEEALEWVRAAGGEAVFAHPLRYGMTRSALGRCLDAFRAAGGEAIEVVSGRQSAEQTRMLAGLAARYGLRSSTGSDFHAPGAAWSELGQASPLPTECVPVWRDWRAGLATPAEA